MTSDNCLRPVDPFLYRLLCQLIARKREERIQILNLSMSYIPMMMVMMMIDLSNFLFFIIIVDYSCNFIFFLSFFFFLLFISFFSLSIITIDFFSFLSMIQLLYLAVFKNVNFGINWSIIFFFILLLSFKKVLSFFGVHVFNVKFIVRIK